MRFFYLMNTMIIECLYQLFLKSNGITTDSRNAQYGTLFFALTGDSFDGNKYAKKALENGCSYAIVDNQDYVCGDSYIKVDNVLNTLQLLGKYHRKQLNIPIIAITGTNGKTTTKELVSSVLGKKYKITYTQGNLNNHIGVPLTLLSMNEDTQIGIIEMGANHMNEIKHLCEIAEPNYGVITNIGKAHLEGFGSFENIINTKKELYDYLKLNDGKAFYNSKNQLLNNIIKDIKLESISYCGEKSNVIGDIMPSDQFLKIDIKIADYRTEVQTQLIGNYNYENVIAAACIGHYFEVDPKRIVEAIEAYAPKNNRSQYLKTNKNHLFLDAYNANPTSVEASVKNFVALNKQNTCVILGDMLELGVDSVKEHQKVIDLLQKYAFDKIILVGDVYNSLKLKDNFLQFKNVDELKKWLTKNNIVNSNVLVKGSRGIHLEKIVELL